MSFRQVIISGSCPLDKWSHLADGEWSVGTWCIRYGKRTDDSQRVDTISITKVTYLHELRACTCNTARVDIGGDRLMKACLNTT